MAYSPIASLRFLLDFFSVDRNVSAVERPPESMLPPDWTPPNRVFGDKSPVGAKGFLGGVKKRTPVQMPVSPSVPQMLFAEKFGDQQFPGLERLWPLLREHPHALRLMVELGLRAGDLADLIELLWRCREAPQEIKLPRDLPSGLREIPIELGAGGSLVGRVMAAVVAQIRQFGPFIFLSWHAGTAKPEIPELLRPNTAEPIPMLFDWPLDREQLERFKELCLDLRKHGAAKTSAWHFVAAPFQFLVLTGKTEGSRERVLGCLASLARD